MAVEYQVSNWVIVNVKGRARQTEPVVYNTDNKQIDLNTATHGTR